MSAESKEWFSNWFDSKYYPVLYNHRNEEEAALFVDTLMQYLKLPSNSVVADMACGEGRYAHQLSKYVASVLGFDLAPERIKKAIADYQSDKVQFFEHDMRSPMHVNYFDAIFNFFTSFGYFNTRRDHLNAAQSLANGLKPGGILVIDYFNNQFVTSKLIAEEQVEKSGVNFEIKRYVTERKIVKEITVLDPGQAPLHFEERVSNVGLQEFTQLFEEVGLSLVHTFGDYNLSELDVAASPRLIMIFKK